MKQWIQLVSVIALCCFSWLGFAQEQAEASAEQAAWMKHMMPGDNHAMMAKMVGKWDFTMTVWMDPSAPPMKSKGTGVFTMVMGGRYLQQDYTGEMMGMPVHGRAMTAYDNTRKVFISTWLDNMGTSISYGEGSYDEEKKIIHIKGVSTDSQTGGQVPYRYTTEMKDENNMVFTMFGTVAGQEVKFFEFVYTRAK